MEKLSAIVKNIPQCVGIIMDGNRRWARERGLPTLEGHRQGAEKLSKIALWCKKLGIPNVIVYAFSTENWNRTEKEVNYLMGIFSDFISKKSAELKKENIKIKFVGQLDRLAPDLQEGIKQLEKETNEGSNTLCVAVSYGGRAEILQATKIIARHNKIEEIESMQEEDFAKYLWTKDLSDPDIIIRTGSEKRLSNFLLWQSVYSELFFSKTYWPAFTETEFADIIKEYSERQRRRGK
jgi:undecaprenyl diphosphate synthase